jgi:hypothetical protein
VPPLHGDPGADPGPVPGRVRDTTAVAGQSVDVNQPFVVAPAHDSALQAHVGVPVGALPATVCHARMPTDHAVSSFAVGDESAAVGEDHGLGAVVHVDLG